MYRLGVSAITANVIMAFFAFIAVLLRVIARRRTRLGLKADDYVIFIALAFVLAVCITGIWAAAIGLFGPSLWQLGLQRYSLYQKVLRVDALLCYLCFGLVKTSILLFFKRLFPLQGFKIVVYAVMAVVIGFSFSMIMAQIFSQKPFDRGWDLPADYNPITDYHPSFDFTVFLISTASINLFLDVVILLLPVRLVSTLQMSSGKRLSLVVIFGTGAFCVIASAVRIFYCVRAYQAIHGVQQPYTITDLTCLNDLWAHIEAGSSIIAACLPTLAPLFKGSDPNSSRIAGVLDRWLTKLGYLQSRDSEVARKSLPSPAPSSMEFLHPQQPYSPIHPEVVHSLQPLEPLQPLQPVWDSKRNTAKSEVIYIEKSFRGRPDDMI